MQAFKQHLSGSFGSGYAPDDVFVRLDITSIYYHQGRPDQVKMTGLSTTRKVTMLDTSYYGEVLTIEPQQSAGDEDVVITGRAMDRATGLPLANVPLNLVISVGGFERANTIYTDSIGSFVYSFKPLAGESGLYKVRAVHPDLLDRPVQGQFVISRVSVSPTSINLSVPRNYERTIAIQVSTSEGTEVQNLGLVYAPEDQPEGEVPQGIHLTTGSSLALLGSKKAASLPFTVWADNTTEQTGRIVLKVASEWRGTLLTIFNIFAKCVKRCGGRSMPRQARLDCSGMFHHVVVRGIEKRKIADDDEDRDRFVSRLE